ncbi:vacuolar protein-sorting-associated protein 33 like protein [Quercus suber]|uniref:Vacuolar protein-sorting-associated protein 33 like protein n=1 Tax=Quercus suber TaxID=58331 RepID=A0AAW0KZI8_QUESU
MKCICSNVHDDVSKGLQREYFVYFVPHCTVVCEKILEEENVYNLMTIGEYPLYIVPLDEDVLSFELDLAYKESQVDRDTSSLWHIAKAIHKLEFSFGVIPNVRAKGKASVRVADILNRMQAEEPVNSPYVDMVTLMLSQLTYEGLLDEGRFSSSPSYDTLQASANMDKVADGRWSLVLVVFIGGITFAEISALRFLSAQEGMAYDLIVGTTKIVSGHSLAETFVERLG